MLWTGGVFGPEAGLLAVAWMVAGCTLILIWARSRRDRPGGLEMLAQYEPAGARGEVAVPHEPADDDRATEAA